MLKSTVLLTLLLACSNAQASVGLLLTPTVPEESYTQVLVVRADNTTTVASRSVDFPDAARIFPIYPGMKNVRVGKVPLEVFETLNQDTSVTLEHLVEVDPCGPAPSPPVTKSPSFELAPAKSTAELFKLKDLQKTLDVELSQGQLDALDIESKKGAEFLVLRPEAGSVPSVAYDAKLLELPTRLGQSNQSKHQRLRVFIIADARFEVSNFWLSYLPTNVELRPNSGVFAEIHQSVVTLSDEQKQKAFWVEFAGAIKDQSAVVTRLSHSSAAGKLGDNVTLSPTNPLVGGMSDERQGAFGGEKNDFKIRYFSKQKFKGAVDCEKPEPGRWYREKVEFADAWPSAEPPIELSPLVVAPIAELYVSPTPAEALAPVEPASEAVAKKAKTPKKTGCSVGSSGENTGIFVFLVGLFLMRRRQ